MELALYKCKSFEGDDHSFEPKKQMDYQNQQNPMLNPLIVENMLRHFANDSNSLKNTRLVCKQWLELSYKYWQKSAEIVIKQAEEESNGLSEFLHKLDNNIFVEFECYKISHWNVPSMEVELVGQFWNTCGHWMRELCVDTCTFRDFSELESIVSTKTPNLVKFSYLSSRIHPINVRERRLGGDWTNVIPQSPPELGASVVQKNLKSISIRLIDERCTMGWIDFLSHFPNLEDVALGTSIVTDIIMFVNALYYFRQMDKSKLQIKHLDIKEMSMCRYEEQFLMSLYQAGLQLKTFRLDLLPRTDQQIATILLKLYSDTLETLELHKVIYDQPYKNFPFGVQFDSLTELQLHGHVAWSFAFLKNTPNLKSLTVFQTPNLKKRVHFTEEIYLSALNVQPIQLTHDMVEEASEECDMTGVRLENLEKFICGEIGMKKGESVKQLAEWMPNLKILSMVFNKVNFPAVCKHWPNLVELEVLDGSSIDDESITGIKDFQDDSIASGRAPNVSDLKSLRKFILASPSTINLQDCTHMFHILRTMQYFMGSFTSLIWKK